MDLIQSKLILRYLPWLPSRIEQFRNTQLMRQVKVYKLAIKGFNEDRIQIRASALTYYTVLSIVPMVAMLFVIARGFGFEAWLEIKLQASLEGQEQVFTYITDFAKRYLSNINGGYITGIGIAVLLWSVAKLLGNIETSFNHIWQIKQARAISRRISDYFSLVVIAPVLIFLSSSVTIFLTDQVKAAESSIPLIAYLGVFLGSIFSLLPYVLIWLVFTLLYIIMPNTKVKFSSALVGGIIAGTAFQLMQWGYIHLQSELTSYNAIYGTFAALPLFLIWLQISWLIVLFGAEVSFAKQNLDHYEAESVSFNISVHLKRSVSILLLKQIEMNFVNGIPPLTASLLAKNLDLPVRLVRDILYELVGTKLLSETITGTVRENAYQPARDLSRLTVVEIIEILDKIGNDKFDQTNENGLKKITQYLDKFVSENKASTVNTTLMELK